MYKVAGTVNFDPLWKVWQKAKTSAQTFESSMVETVIDKKRVTRNAGTTLQHAYKADNLKHERIKKNEWDRDLLDIID